MLNCGGISENRVVWTSHKRQRHKPLGINCIFNSLKKKSVFCCFHKQIQQLLFSIGLISMLNYLQLHNSFNKIISIYLGYLPFTESSCQKCKSRSFGRVDPIETHTGEGCRYTIQYIHLASKQSWFSLSSFLTQLHLLCFWRVRLVLFKQGAGLLQCGRNLSQCQIMI